MPVIYSGFYKVKVWKHIVIWGDYMLHTLMIKHRIISPKDFDEIYKSLDKITGEKPRKVNEGNYITEH